MLARDFSLLKICMNIGLFFPSIFSLNYLNSMTVETGGIQLLLVTVLMSCAALLRQVLRAGLGVCVCVGGGVMQQLNRA